MVEEESEYGSGGRQQGIAAEILGRHRKSTQPESQQVCAVLGAVLEVVKGEGLEPTPTALFAALMSALENDATRSTAEVATAVGTILSTVLSRTPSSVVRAKYQASSALIADVMDLHMDKAAPLKAYLGCLAQLLAAADPSSWGPLTVRPWGMLLHLATDPRPKVRKRAATGMVEVLAALQRTPALNTASDALQRACTKVFQAPEAAARAAAAASNKKRAEAEAAITEAVSEALFMMGALKEALPLVSAAAAAGVAQALIGLYPLKQALLTRHATGVLVALADSSASNLPADSLAELLKVVLARTDVWESRDVDALLSLIAFLGAASRRLHSAEHKSLGSLLPRVAHALVQQLGAEQDGVRFGAAEELQRVLQSCLDEKLLAAKPGANGKPTAAQGVVSAVASALSPQYADAWPAALPIVGAVLRQLGAQHVAMSVTLLERLDVMLTGASQGMEDGDLDAVECQPAVEAAMGAALQALGPEAVLNVLPLQLQEGLDGRGTARTWMLPLLRRHVRGSGLTLWVRSLLPLARVMGSQAAAATKVKTPGSAARAAVCRTLEMQLWHTLPAFANEAKDVAEAFTAMARDVGTAFQNRTDLRSPICLAISRLCRQAWRGASEAGILQECNLLGTGPFAAGTQEEPEDGASGTTDVAALKKDIEALQRFAPNFLSLLFNSFVEADVDARAEIGAAITAYSAVSAAPMLASVFRTIVQKLIKVTQDSNSEFATSGVTEGGDTPTERRCTFMELALCVGGGLDTAGITTLYKAAIPGLKDKDSAVQKKAYKMLAYICEEHSAFTRDRAQEIVEHLVSGLPSAHPAVKRHRLRSVKALILLLDGASAPAVALPADAENPAEVASAESRRQVVASLVSEIVMCTKEANKKTRAAAYDLLVEVGKAMDNNRLAAVRLGSGAMEDGEDGPASGLQNLFTMVMAGLVASHPHMISATVTALARLVFEFANRLAEDLPELLNAVLMLFRTKSREVVKACLGFVKVAVMRLSAWQLEPHVKAILEGVLLWAADSKNRFKLKVRTIVEALAKRCGYDAVAAGIPESDAKLLVHIRKQKERKARQREERRGEEDGGDVDMDARSRASSKASSRARTARASEWGHTAIFSDLLDDEDDEEGGRGGGGRSRLGDRSGRAPASAAGRGAKGGRLRDTEEDPMDLLGQGAARDLMRVSNSRKTNRAEDSFQRGEDGRMVIAEEEEAGGKRGKQGGRKRGRGEESDDESDGDDSLGALTQAVKSGAGRVVKFANSVGGGSVGGRTARTAGGRSTAKASSAARSRAGSNKEHSGDRFKPKRKGTGGDMKASGKVEPYAYWPLDKKMLNRRSAKQATAKKGLDKVLAGSAAPRGNKAKRARRQ
eukprot:jgi/Tetstr1/439710/TSEL_028129.t1